MRPLADILSEVDRSNSPGRGSPVGPWCKPAALDRSPFQAPFLISQAPLDAGGHHSGTAQPGESRHVSRASTPLKPGART
jgi:hypothetical protein